MYHGALVTPSTAIYKRNYRSYADYFVIMSLSNIPNLWVPLALLSLIVMAAVFFSRSS